MEFWGGEFESLVRNPQIVGAGNEASAQPVAEVNANVARRKDDATTKNKKKSGSPPRKPKDG